jgi:lambda repressor-like predicted transcriptional regulator
MRIRPHPARYVLEREGRSVKWLGQQTGYHPDHLGRVLNGRLSPSPRLMAAVGMALGEDASTLFRQGSEVAR